MIKKYLDNTKAFTLIELLVIMGLFAVLSSFVGLNLIKPQISVNIDSTVNLLVSDIKAQQIKSMSGNTDGSVTSQDFGIYIGSDQYTLFTGSTYNASDPKNFVVNFDTGSTLSNNLTSSQIVFQRMTGNILNYNSGSNIVVTHSSGNSKTININALGVVEIL